MTATTVVPPTVGPVRVVADRRGVRTVTVVCPHCRRRHVHGWLAGEPRPGLRAAHCGPGVSYVITAPTENRP